MDFSPFLQKAQNDKHLFVILTCQNDKIRRHHKMAAKLLQAFKLGACRESAVFANLEI